MLAQIKKACHTHTQGNSSGMDEKRNSVIYDIMMGLEDVMLDTCCAWKGKPSIISLLCTKSKRPSHRSGEQNNDSHRLEMEGERRDELLVNADEITFMSKECV